jgi:Xaa-Pro aminopeptidase
MNLNTHSRRLLIDLMTERGWDLLLLYGHAWRKDFFRYLANINFSGPHIAAALLRSGEVRVVVAHPWDFETLSTFAEGKVTLACDFGAGLKKLMADAKSAKVAIAGLEIMQESFVEAVRAGNEPPVSATSAVEELRRVKNSGEVSRLKQAAELSDRGYEHFVQAIEVGMTEYELVAEVEAFLKSNGAEDNFMLIGSGGTEVMGMKPPTERKFQAGDSVTTELTPQVDGYWAQICRTLVLGEPSAKQRESFAIFSEAQKAAEDLIKPGVDISDVARVQNDVFRKHGYGEYTGPKYTRVRGHNLGLHPDENPYVLEDVHYIMKEGMVVIAHPNTYLPLSGYMVFGDSLMVTDRGCTCLNSTERRLFQK